MSRGLSSSRRCTLWGQLVGFLVQMTNDSIAVPPNNLISSLGFVGHNRPKTGLLLHVSCVLHQEVVLTTIAL